MCGRDSLGRRCARKESSVIINTFEYDLLPPQSHSRTRLRATRMALLVEDLTPSRMGFSTLRGSSARQRCLFRNDSHKRGQQPWEVLSFLSAPWEKFARRATRDKHPPARVLPTFREWLRRSLRGIVESVVETENPGVRGTLWATSPRTRWPPSSGHY